MIRDDTTSAPRRSTAGLVDALSNARRRRVLRCLRAASGQTLSELARSVARREPWSSDARDGFHRIEIDLYHCQLPRLEDEGLLRHDRRRALVALTERGVRAERWLRTSEAVERGPDAE